MDIRCVRPVSADGLRANVRHAVSLGLPSVEPDSEMPGVLHIYASGPSLKLADLQWPALALNGAIKEFTARSIAPTWWAACDPQAIVADFLRGSIRPWGGYLIASRCDPSVFTALRGQFVRLWHVADEGADEVADAILMPDAPSVTINVLYLAALMGWRCIVVHGWDGCYTDNISHADGTDDGKKRVTVECNGQQFVTNPSWIVECEDAKQVFGLLVGLQGMDIKVSGNGLMATALNPLAAELKRIKAEAA